MLPTHQPHDTNKNQEMMSESSNSDRLRALFFKFGREKATSEHEEASGNLRPIVDRTPPGNPQSGPGSDTDFDFSGEFDLPPFEDRVVSKLLEKGFIDEIQIQNAWKRWNRARENRTKYPLWRELVYDPAIEDRSPIFAIAAAIYAFEPIDIAGAESLRLIENLKNRYSEDDWKEMIEYCVVPVVDARKNPARLERLSFATPDPSHLFIRRLVGRLCQEPHELRFAPALELHRLISTAFPHMKHLLRPPDVVAPPLY